MQDQSEDVSAERAPRGFTLGIHSFTLGIHSFTLGDPHTFSEGKTGPSWRLHKGVPNHLL